MTTTTDKNWTPVRNGLIFCSPACGGNCTITAYDQANREANALAARMGKGWKPRVWENLGWHYSVKKGVAAIYPPKGLHDTFTAYVNTNPQFVYHHANPLAALGLGLHALRQHIEETTNQLDEITK